MTGEPVGSTADNLRSAIAGETYEYTEMYPGFAKTARDEGLEEISEWLETLARAEKSHAGRFRRDSSQSRPDCPAADCGARHPRVLTPKWDGAARRVVPSVVRLREDAMTTTYDPNTPATSTSPTSARSWSAVYDLCHGCRLCFNLCPSFPTLFDLVDARDGDVAAHDAGRAGPGRRRVLPVQALLREVPLRAAARVGTGLPAPDDAGTRRAARLR